MASTNYKLLSILIRHGTGRGSLASCIYLGLSKALFSLLSLIRKSWERHGFMPFSLSLLNLFSAYQDIYFFLLWIYFYKGLVKGGCFLLIYMIKVGGLTERQWPERQLVYGHEFFPSHVFSLFPFLFFFFFFLVFVTHELI